LDVLDRWGDERNTAIRLKETPEKRKDHLKAVTGEQLLGSNHRKKMEKGLPDERRKKKRGAIASGKPNC